MLYTANMELLNQGKIARIILPDDWQEDPHAAASTTTGYLRRFRPPGESDVEFAFYYRGGVVSDATAQQLRATMEAPPHSLSDTELAALSELLGDKCDAESFRLQGARTAVHNARRVLVIQGEWTITERETLHAFVDVESSGFVVEEIIYTAPKESYQHHLKAARGALKTIEWKQDPSDVLKKMGGTIRRKS